MVPNPITPSQPLSAQTAAAYLRWLGRLGFWGQLGAAILGGGLLLLALLSRQLSEESSNALTSLALTLAIAGVIALGIGVVLSMRYSRLARQLGQPQAPTPDRVSTIQSLEAGLLVSAIGLGLTLVGGEFGALTLLAKAMTQPQGVAVYTPEKVVRVLDAIVILVNVGLAITHALAAGGTVWLVKLIAKEV
ncbi:MAG: DUF3611 family protein [Leptolyngbya sp. SIO4C1]|nr:DUF3611 family protein [Leptolyngbya sp. SIO4C1]